MPKINLTKIIDGLWLLFASVFGFLLFTAMFSSQDYSDEYLEAVKLKRDKLDLVQSPKIVLLGGQNVNYSLNSSTMEMVLGLPVVNMGVSSNIGIEKQIKYIKRDVNASDIIILSPDYNFLSDINWTGESVEEQIIEPSTETYIDDNLKEEKLIGSFQEKISAKKIAFEFPDDKMAILRKQRAYFDDIGVGFFLTPPMTMAGSIDTLRAKNFFERLSKESGIPILMDASIGTYEKKYFKDKYRNNQNGRVRRTTDLAEMLRSRNLVHNEVINLLPKTGKKNPLGISDFNESNGIRINEKDDFQLKFKVADYPNYLRARQKNKNYTGYNFNIEIKCTDLQAKKIRFKGIKTETFDSISNLGKGIYRFYKNKMENVYYIDKSSYMGITVLSESKKEKNPITITEVSLSDMPLEYTMLSNTVASLQLKENNEVSFVVRSADSNFSLSAIFDKYNAEELAIRTNEIYKVVTTNSDIYLKHYDSGINILKWKMEKGAALKPYSDGVIQVFVAPQINSGTMKTDR